MYTIEMATAFKALTPPENFGVVIYDSEKFITVMINPKDLVDLSEENKPKVVQYINDVKRTLESFGATVFIVREALEE
jgi:hypothetical protein